MMIKAGRRARSSHDHLTTYFFTKFPDSFDAKAMMNIFQHYGNIVEVVIPTKRDKGGRRFGFARFDKVKDVRRFGIELDNIIIGRNKIYVNPSRFHRESGTRRQHRQEEGEDQTRYLSKPKVQPRRNGETKKSQHKEAAGLSYAHVVQEGGSHKRKVSILWGQDYSFRANLVLMEEQEEAEINALIEDAGGWLDQWFKEIRPWSTRDVDNDILVWSRVYGISVHAWNDNFFTLLSQPFGTFLNLDESTSKKLTMDVARIMVRMPGFKAVDEFITVKINHEFFQLRIIENSHGPMCIVVPSKGTEQGRDAVNSSSEDEEGDFQAMEKEEAGEGREEVEGGQHLLALTNFVNNNNWGDIGGGGFKELVVVLNWMKLTKWIPQKAHVTQVVTAQKGEEVKGSKGEGCLRSLMERIKWVASPNQLTLKGVAEEVRENKKGVAVAMGQKKTKLRPTSSVGRKRLEPSITGGGRVQAPNRGVTNNNIRFQIPPKQCVPPTTTNPMRSGGSSTNSSSRRNSMAVTSAPKPKATTMKEGCLCNPVGKFKVSTTTENSLLSAANGKVWKGVKELGVGGDEEDAVYVDRLVANEENDTEVRRQRELSKQDMFDIYLLQETKRSNFDDFMIHNFWGHKDVEWVAKESDGLSGGLLIMWNEGLFKVKFCFSGDEFLGLCVEWKEGILYIVDVYSPCSFSGKRKLWNDLLEFKLNNEQGDWCIGGDFNAVLKARERKGSSSAFTHNERAEFCQFVESMELIDVPVTGKKFTWFSANGKAMSRLDRFLLSDNFIVKEEVSGQWIGDRDISDHCPIWLICLNLNWGPKPFKRLKEELREWNREVFGILDLNIEKTVKELNEVEGLAANYDVNSECWSTMKDYVMEFFNEFHESAVLPKAITASFLALIPKKDHPQQLSDYRPIFLIAEGLTGLVNKAVDIGKFDGFKVDDSIRFQILQFVDDTVLLGESSWENVRTIKSILRGFELVSGLKINFVKSKLYDINVEDNFLDVAATFLSCSFDSIPFKFLGIPDQGGLGIKDIELFNMALLCKWKWRCLIEKDALWYKLLSYSSALHWNPDWMGTLSQEASEENVALEQLLIGLDLHLCREDMALVTTCLRMMFRQKWGFSVGVFSKRSYLPAPYLLLKVFYRILMIYLLFSAYKKWKIATMCSLVVLRSKKCGSKFWCGCVLIATNKKAAGNIF
ncbi:hypothetical protein TSUD_53800 [Trifolium subterraneum]|uniref:RRM domain-containing protein n=1 Tax=Trifolium subterraneum TaxID=3900 RepID=A0A2Z6MRH7_TRISU|nr:hypothetical protein TSUD_53800 [Trifolium subterraneum]